MPVPTALGRADMILEGIRLFLLVLLGCLCASAQTSYRYDRRYTSGEKFEYQLKTKTEAREQIATSMHEVSFRSGIPYETVRWMHPMETKPVPPYELSLHPK